MRSRRVLTAYSSAAGTREWKRSVTPVVPEQLYAVGSR